MNTKTVIIVLIAFLLGSAFSSVGLFPFHWGFPFIPHWDNLLVIGLLVAFFVLYSKLNDLEERMNRFDRHRL